MRAVGIVLVVLLPSTLQENVSYRTHAIGFGLGVVSAFVYFRRNRESIRAAEVVEVGRPVRLSRYHSLLTRGRGVILGNPTPRLVVPLYLKA